MLKQVKLRTTTHTWALDLSILSLIIFALYVCFLGSIPLGVPDEARYTEIPREMLALGDFVTPHLNYIKYFEKPPLFYWMQTLPISLLGLSEWSARLMTMLMGIGGCLITYITARQLFNRETGLLASIILATSFLYYGMSHLITLDMTLSTWITGSCALFLLATQTTIQAHRRHLMSGSAAFAALAVMTKGLIGLILPGMIVFSWMLIFNQWHLLKKLSLLSSFCIFLVLVMPWHIAVQIQNPEFFHFYFITQQFERYFTMSADRYFPNWFFVPVLLMGFFPWTCFLFQTLYHNALQIKNNFRAHSTLGFLLIWAMVIFTFFSLSHSKLIPYIVPIFSPLSILVADYLCQGTGRGKMIGVIGFILMCLVMAGAALIIPPTVFEARLIGLASILSIGAFITGVFYFKHRLPAALASIAMTAIITFISVYVAIPTFDKRSIKPLALTLQPLLAKDDIVVSYKHYYQDLPVYIKRDVIVSNWRNELGFGALHQADGAARLINIPTFFALFNSDKTVFVLTRNEYYNDLLRDYPHLHFYLISKTSRNTLFSNKEHTS